MCDWISVIALLVRKCCCFRKCHLSSRCPQVCRDVASGWHSWQRCWMPSESPSEFVWRLHRHQHHQRCHTDMKDKSQQLKHIPILQMTSKDVPGLSKCLILEGIEADLFLSLCFNCQVLHYLS